MKKIIATLLIICTLGLSQGCATYKVYQSNQPKQSVVIDHEQEIVWHITEAPKEKSFWRKAGEYALGMTIDMAINMGIMIGIQELND